MNVPHPDGRNRDVNRIALRYAFEGHVRIAVQRDGQAKTAGGWVRDIGEGGICAFVAEELDTGGFVTLTIPLQGPAVLVVSARVARRLGTQYGFQFLTLSPEQRILIQSVVKGRQPLSTQ